MAQANTGDFLTENARLSFSEGLWEPTSQGNQGGDLKYGCTLIYPATFRKFLEDKCEMVIGMKWGPKGVADFRKGLIKNPVFAGDGKEAHSKATGELWAGFGPEVCFIRCKNNDDAPPVVLFKSKLVAATKAEVYSGCYGNAVLNGYTWDHPTGGRGVTFNIRQFQKLKDGESLGGRTPVEVDKWFVETGNEEDGVDIFS